MISIGTQVVFHEKVYTPTYSPHYDAYKDHTFVVVNWTYDFVFHYELDCVDDPSVKVQGLVHEDVLVRVGVKSEENKKTREIKDGMGYSRHNH